MAEVTTQGRNQSALDDPAALEEEKEEEARTQLARMIALHGYNPSLVEDDIFRRFVGILNPRFKVPSRGAIEEMCDAIVDDTKEDFFLRNMECWIAAATYSLSVGRAKAMDKHFLYVAQHFIDDEWKLQRVIVSALLDEPDVLAYAGPILGVHVLRGDVRNVLFESYSPMNTVSVMVADSDIQAMLSSRIKRGGMTGTELHAATFVDLVLHSVARCLVPTTSFMPTLSQDLEGLQLTRQERQRLLSRLGPDYQWAYADQEWYLCYCSLEAIQNSSKDSSRRSSTPFRELLWRLWGRVHRAIRAVSAPGRSTSNLCLVELFNLRDVLRSELDRADIYSEAGRHCLEDGKDVAGLFRQALETLDEAIQDSCLIWSVPLVLDPRYKLRFIKFCFERAYGASEAEKYISQVKTMVKKMYGTYVCYSDSSTRVAANNKDDHVPLEQAWNEYCCSQLQLDDGGMGNGEEAAELVRYLEDRLHPQTTTHQEDFDALSWWKVHRLEYPNVARLARHALAMPTCSKLSSEQMARVKSKIRGYSKREYYEYYDV